jgi:hypothetical protein
LDFGFATAFSGAFDFSDDGARHYSPRRLDYENAF